jgi:hypothetical protein
MVSYETPKDPAVQEAYDMAKGATPLGVRVDVLQSDVGADCTLDTADDLALPQFGVVCRVGDVYRDMPLG